MKTNKKTYCQPSLEVVMLEATDLIATSDPKLSLDLDNIEDEGYAD